VRYGAAPSPPPSATPADSGRLRVGILVIAILLVVGGGAGAWMFARRNHNVVQTTPKEQALKFFTAARSRDWKTVYATSEIISSSYPSAEAYEKKMKEMEQGPLFIGFYNDMMVKPVPTLGEPTISGTEATLPLTVTSPYLKGRTRNLQLTMKNFDGVWKVARGSDQDYWNIVTGEMSFEGTGDASGRTTGSTHYGPPSGDSENSGFPQRGPGNGGQTGPSRAPTMQSLEQKLHVGMTKEQVAAALGRPTSLEYTVDVGDQGRHGYNCSDGVLVLFFESNMYIRLEEKPRWERMNASPDGSPR
jgi:hypothetical protein